jgi:membrane-bound inhibitor of C-type lysozyme
VSPPAFRPRWDWTGALLAGALVAGCGGGEPPARSQTAAPPPVSVARTYVFDCGEGFGFVARISAEEAVLLLPEGEQRLVAVPTDTGARFTDGTVTLWMRGSEALYETPQALWKDCLNDPGRAEWEDARRRNVAFRALDRAAGWRLEIHRDGRVSLEADDGRSGVATLLEAVETSESGDALRYRTRAVPPFEVLAETAPCRVPGGVEILEWRVTMGFGPHRLEGCGREV